MASSINAPGGEVWKSVERDNFSVPGGETFAAATALAVEPARRGKGVRRGASGYAGRETSTGRNESH